ncbi:cobaltochelatase subunit CobN [Lichenihabitans sp. PAMC28606]|uniref:cobaltochelatase subunit CobN n=1 Tax=Lichenihabitans sp. PAMC28606 TaxID=2880932 RepID=UPI001D0B158E|nr:cobaltochelatase subunit CobN [Lichenihabitans sp. PAMC28606]UDL94980.1 cobaltochelatase subunit CobN [Lichenihabitans sp. PAMC28606]
MHLLQTQERTLDDEAAAIDLALSPADLVVLSFTDSDLAVSAAAFDAIDGQMPSLRVANLARLKHPYSVDLFVETLAPHARFVLVRLLGGLDYWRYGVEELGAAARRYGFHLAVVPGDGREDLRLDKASTLPQDDLRRLWAYFQSGGAANIGQALLFMASRAGHAMAWNEPKPVPHAGLFEAGCRAASDTAPHALILFYRSALLAADTAPIEALADALAARGARVTSLFATSLKDPDSKDAIRAALQFDPPQVILNTTAFSARSGQRAAITDRAKVPVLQVMLAGATAEQWSASTRGLGAADLAMNVVLPEVDGRIIAGAISFKAEADRRSDLEFTRIVHRAEPDRIAHAADLAMAWGKLARKPRHARRIGCVISDYPGRDGRTGYALGLDTPASVLTIADHLREAGFSIGAMPDSASMMRQLTADDRAPVLSLADYRLLFESLPPAFAASVTAAWGDAGDDPVVNEEQFAFPMLRSGTFLLAVQPDRGAPHNRRTDYHDTALPPCHAYVAFYLWLRVVEQIDAMIHLGTHGTLEWLPGKAVALSQSCGPEAVLGPVPVVYPFIVNNPGEAAQAKRRIAAVTIGHLTPPLMEAGHHGVTLDLEALFDEYAQAVTLDQRRAKVLAKLILDKAAESGVATDCGVDPTADPDATLAALDAWLCDIKEMRIGDGLHVFGRNSAAAVDGAELCGPAEFAGLLTALDGAFVPPGPSGAPSRGRLDVLPTGRNLFTVDPRAVPTRTAYDLGKALASEVMTRYAQDHGDWPRSLVLDLWGSATMRTGGDDLGQAFALIGVRPRWDPASSRVLGYDILPSALLDWPRVDVTLRISGLFRDTFPEQIALFDAASRAVSMLDETADDNALVAAARAGPDGALPPRVFGAAPGQYGVGIARTIAAGAWENRSELGEAYLAATSHAYGAGEGIEASAAFRAQVGSADVYIHVQDQPGADLLDAATYADHQGGFAAAASALGNTPALYQADTSVPGRQAVRSLAEEIARTVRGRAGNPRWIAGQMRHGHRGAAEIAETVDNLFAFAATTDAVASRHFDLLFEATLGDEAVRDFLCDSNPLAARAIAERFSQAIDRQFWTSRRNSVASILAEMMEGGA